MTYRSSLVCLATGAPGTQRRYVEEVCIREFLRHWGTLGCTSRSPPALAQDFLQDIFKSHLRASQKGGLQGPQRICRNHKGITGTRLGNSVGECVGKIPF